MRTTVTLNEAAVVATICFGFSIAFSIAAVLKDFPTSPFSEAGTVWAMGVEVCQAVAALVYLSARGFDISRLAPNPTLRGAGVGLGLFFVAWVAGIVATAPFASSWASQPISEMMANTRMSLPIVVAFAMVNGAFEEVFLLGVLVRGLRGYGLSIACGVPLLVRLLYHLYQGPVGAVWIVAFGIVFTLYFVRFQALWPPVFAHILWDIVPFIR